MSGVQRFEDLIAWQRARELTRAVYSATRAPMFARDFGLAAQIQRAAVSTMANIAEGFERSRQGEFHQFLSVAKASCAEVRSHLYAALDAGYLDQPVFDALLSTAEEAGRLIGGLRAAVERRRVAGGASSRPQHSAPSTSQHRRYSDGSNGRNSRRRTRGVGGGAVVCGDPL